MASHDQTGVFNDFYTPSRNYSKRLQLYQFVLEKFDLMNTPFNYLEFGVSQGGSFRWWVGNAQNAASRFYGFDTFEGLPENWGLYKKGDMSAFVPTDLDDRSFFVKGLFQDTLPQFLKDHDLSNETRKVIHLDADLFTSTLFTLASLAPFLRKGDILFFDEFNVPNHEFHAFKIFTEAYYFKTKLLGAVNNYYQVALIVE